MEATYNLCMKLIDIGKGALVESKAALFLLAGSLTDEEYTAIMARLHPVESDTADTADAPADTEGQE